MKVVKIKKNNLKARIEIGFTTSDNDSSFPYAPQDSEKYREQVNSMLAEGVIKKEFPSYFLELEDS
jgi:hypothetical protein